MSSLAVVGRIRASAISADGVYVVGRDIKAGTWHTNLNGVYAFQINGPRTWYRTGP